ncbi:HAD hydrolase-like protein [Isoptericola sediminis]|uniref:HAD hydrolase-like protein n=1 Tax=Isoptericola sediminis TaxID=2733572 RepID=UPI0031B60170
MTQPLVLLDLDGTLMDSAPGITASVAHAYRTIGLPVPDDATLRTFVGPPVSESFAGHGVPADRADAAVEAYTEAFTAGGMFDCSVFDGVADALGDLRAAGYELVVATSKPEMYARPICDRFGLSDLVDRVHGSAGDGSTSTKADVVAAALAGSGRLSPVDPAHGPVLMVGDREHDVHGAAAHGIDCLGVAWGYAPDGELQEAGAVDMVEEVTALAFAVTAALTVDAGAGAGVGAGVGVHAIGA